jgi:hypothetical protein
MYYSVCLMLDHHSPFSGWNIQVRRRTLCRSRLLFLLTPRVNPKHDVEPSPALVADGDDDGIHY